MVLSAELYTSSTRNLKTEDFAEGPEVLSKEKPHISVRLDFISGPTWTLF
jgi:hypothetical protein